MEEYTSLHIYDINGKIINKIILNKLGTYKRVILNEKLDIKQYDSNLLLLYFLKVIYFIYFSPDYSN